MGTTSYRPGAHLLGLPAHWLRPEALLPRLPLVARAWRLWRQLLAFPQPQALSPGGASGSLVDLSLGRRAGLCSSGGSAPRAQSFPPSPFLLPLPQPSQPWPLCRQLVLMASHQATHWWEPQGHSSSPRRPIYKPPAGLLLPCLSGCPRMGSSRQGLGQSFLNKVPSPRPLCALTASSLRSLGRRCHP